MAKDKYVKKNRKRRSFYEPQSKVFNDWLDAQTDLGMSIQLLIADAIETYGSGDAIEAYFRTRIAGGIPEKPKPSEAKAVSQFTGAVGAETLVEPVVEKPLPAPVERVLPASPVKPEATVQDVVTPLPAVAEQAPTPAPVSVPAEDDDAYDPIAIMMQDVGSKVK